MFTLKELLAVSLLLLGHAANPAHSQCSFQSPPTSRPLVMQKFGSRVILHSGLSDFVLDESAEIEAFCGNGFTLFNAFDRWRGYETPYSSSHEQLLKFMCISGSLYVYKQNEQLYESYVADDDNFDIDDQYGQKNVGHKISGSSISCSSTVFSMYESRHKLPNCTNFMSYALGARTSTPIIIAGLCYDLEKVNLKYVTYKQTQRERNNVLDLASENYPRGFNGSSLRMPLNQIGHFFRFASDAGMREDIKIAALTNFWLRIANYELGSIVQTTTHYSEAFAEFGDYLNTIWWRNLRTGNWQRFMELLGTRSDFMKYDIYAGTSGVVQVPVANKCRNENRLVIQSHGRKQDVPQFIWTYMQSADAAEDFVVIGYNSPYFEYFDRNATILCNDMCDEVDWLQPMQDSRRISTLGFFYCCHPDDVVGLLDGFPLNGDQ